MWRGRVAGNMANVVVAAGRRGAASEIASLACNMLDDDGDDGDESTRHRRALSSGSVIEAHNPPCGWLGRATCQARGGRALPPRAIFI